MPWQACSIQLSWDASVWCHLATTGIFKSPDEYIASGHDCSNWALSVLWHAQHTLMGLLTDLCIHPKKLVPLWHNARGNQFFVTIAGCEYVALAGDLENKRPLVCPSAATYTLKLSTGRMLGRFRLTCCKSQYLSEKQLWHLIYSKS